MGRPEGPRGGEGGGWERSIAEALAAGQPVADTRFDRLLGPALQRLAPLHFTPVEVARRAAAWLTAGGATEVADLGSGAGKFCLVGAACAGGARFTGIEQRPGLVQVARDAARRMGLANAQFVRGDLRAVPLHRYQAFYVYDPFSEPGAEPDEWLDPCPPTVDRDADVAALLGRLAEAPAGTRVALYCGLGGPTPEGYRLAEEIAMNERGDALFCWEKVAAR